MIKRNDIIEDKALKEIQEKPISELIDIINKNKKKKNKQAIKNLSEQDTKQEIVEAVLKLSPAQIVLVKDYIVGKAEIVYKDELIAMEGLKDWVSRMGSKMCVHLEKIIDSEKSSDTSKLTAMKEIFLRLMPPKQVLEYEDKNQKLSDNALIENSLRIVTSVQKSMLKVGVGNVNDKFNT